MSSRAGHASLSPQASAWLTRLSDPLARAPIPDARIQTAELPLLVEAASAHGVLPAMARNLRSLAVGARGSAFVDAADAQHLVETVSNELDQRLIVLVGQNLLLSSHASRIATGFVQDAIPANVVKGPVFARRLYPQPADRSFTDIDVLVAPELIAATSAVLERLGFVLAPGENRGGIEHGEYKWLLPGNDLILVEIQTNLIHSPNLGAGIRLSRADLLAAGDGDGEDATALLLVAAVHGAAGHQFERLQPAVDVLQAARGAAGPIDRKRLSRVAQASGSTVAVQSALDLVGELFDEPLARELADALSPAPWRGLRRKLVTPGTVIHAQERDAGRASWRRRALREIIRRTGVRERTGND